MLGDRDISSFMNRPLEQMAILEQSIKDAIIGDFNILLIPTSEEFFIQKKFSSADFDVFTKIDAFLNLIIKRHHRVCELYSVLTDDMSSGEFELIFRHYPSFTGHFEDETEIWIMIYQLIQGLISLEAVDIPFPCLSRYFVTKDEEGYRLLSPFLFPRFIGEVLLIYLNPLLSMSQKKHHHQEKVEQSLKEFQILILSFISGNTNEDELARRSTTFFAEIENISKRCSVYLIYFIVEIFKSARDFKHLMAFFSANLAKLPQRFQEFYAEEQDRLSGISPNLPRDVQVSRQEPAIPPPQLAKLPSQKEIFDDMAQDIHSNAVQKHPDEPSPAPKVKTRVYYNLQTLPGVLPHKIVEFSDGTSEKLPLSQAERAELEQKSEDSRRASMSRTSRKPFSLSRTRNYELTCEQHGAKTLLFEIEGDAQNTEFESLEKVVNHKDPSNPSEYHAVQETSRRVINGDPKRVRNLAHPLATIN